MVDRHSSRRSHSQRVQGPRSASSRHHQTSQRSTSQRSNRSSRFSANTFDSDIFNGRLGIILLIFAVVAVVLACRLVWLQVVDAQNNLDRGTSREVTVDIEPRRGTIYDRNGTILSYHALPLLHRGGTHFPHPSESAVLPDAV